jgi:origin recognition complex subunit 2
MDKQTPGRRSTRMRQSVNYQESPSNSPAYLKTSRTLKTPKKTENSGAEESNEDNKESKTPKTASQSRRRTRRLTSDEVPLNLSPKKLRNNRTPSTRALESIVNESSPTVEKLDSTPGRRSTRIRTPNRRLQDIDSILIKTPKRKSKVEIIKREEKSNSSNDDKQSDSSDEELSVIEVDDEDSNIAEEDENEKENITKPTTLFDDEEDVDGKKLYSFKTPKKKESMAQLANQTPKTPRHHDHVKSTPSRTPKSAKVLESQKTPTSRPSAGMCTKTPRHVREEIKHKLHKVNYKEESDYDFSADESDYNPNSNSSSSSSSEDEEEDNKSESSSNEDNVRPKTPATKSQPLVSRILKTPSTGLNLRRSTRNKSDYHYILQSDDFFSTQSTKTKTSDHTLERLKNPRLPHEELIKLLANMQMSKHHEKAVKELNEEYKTYFNKWLTLFNEGFTILLHGLGSKRNLLQTFHKDILAHENVIVVNGFFPSLTIKDILDPIVNDILEMSVSNSNPHETVNIIEDELKNYPDFNIFIIVHNIDGTMLRNDKAQSILSRLASIKNINMIASIDHINAPLRKLSFRMFNYNINNL